MDRYQIGSDVGGTFTDVVVSGGTSPTYLKVPTHGGAQAEGVREGLERAAARLGLTLPELLARTDRIVHGTTIATNMMIEGARRDYGVVLASDGRSLDLDATRAERVARARGSATSRSPSAS